MTTINIILITMNTLIKAYYIPVMLTLLIRISQQLKISKDIFAGYVGCIVTVIMASAIILTAEATTVLITSLYGAAMTARKKLGLAI